MSWLAHDALERRRLEVAAGGSLAALAASLREELSSLLDHDIELPPQKARLTRLGGRCPTHGVLLEFDPWSPRSHRCPVCGVHFTADEHYRWWIMNYQLWLAERSVHAAVIGALTDDERCLDVSRRILEQAAASYLTYPNQDNVLGPSRPFFSTYLESIWLLQLCTALATLEAHGAMGAPTLGALLRDRVIEPSATRIASYDEGLSNRQVWNNAALLAAGRLLGHTAFVHHAVTGPNGLEAHLQNGLLADGTWYEGENYHQFAHRGLWYGVQLANEAAHPLAREGVRRFDAGFLAPFITALPDFTFPARRDSQYRVSLQQWRYAESCELGYARTLDERLAATLSALYATEADGGSTGRSTSTAEAERNGPATALTRASLGWKSLLHAARELPAVAPGTNASAALLDGQGYAVFRRDRDRVYVALDFGESGGSHGHPDRLNLWLVSGKGRFLEDVGTGSYVHRDLHWYRSTAAHNAPLVDGASQRPEHNGVLEAFDGAGDFGWVAATLQLPTAQLRRTVVVADGYLVDDLEWTALPDQATCVVDLPYHVDPPETSAVSWKDAAPLFPHRYDTDGFDHIRTTQRLTSQLPVPCTFQRQGEQVRVWWAPESELAWYRMRAPGPPGQREASFVVAHQSGRRGRLRSVWAWDSGIRHVTWSDESLTVSSDERRDEHYRLSATWTIDRTVLGKVEHITLREGAHRSRAEQSQPDARSTTPQRGTAPPPDAHAQPKRSTLSLQLGERYETVLGEGEYRRSELPWSEAGRPRARVAMVPQSDHISFEVIVAKDGGARALHFASPTDANPLDNEHPDTNSDGVQAYFSFDDRDFSWILVPESSQEGRVRVTPRSGFDDVTLNDATWTTVEDGYALRWTLRSSGGPLRQGRLGFVINEMPAERERRRGQLVWHAKRGDWVYLRGDREARESLRAFEVVDG